MSQMNVLFYRFIIKRRKFDLDKPSILSFVILYKRIYE